MMDRAHVQLEISEIEDKHVKELDKIDDML